MKVLTVDDSRMIRTLVRKYLSPLGLEIVEAADGQEGLEHVRKEMPDLVLLDVNMPVMEGPEMLREMRGDSTLKGIPVLMLTAESAQKLVLELIQIGISDYIVKPFEEELLVKKVKKILKMEGGQAGEGNGDSATRVLVFDDNESIHMVVRKFLTGTAEVVTTANPEKAVQLAGEHSPQYLLLDLKNDGLKLIGTLQADGRLKDSRFIGLATKSMANEMQEAQGAGFADVLLKPFDKDALSKALGI